MSSWLNVLGAVVVAIVFCFALDLSALQCGIMAGGLYLLAGNHER